MIGQLRLHERECESTQALLLGRGLPEGAIATTDHQTAGRGRLGRVWEAAPGTAVLVSVLLRPPPDRRAQELSLVTALAVAETVEAATGLDTQIKWPNDVLLSGAKIAGILAERRGDEVVVGIGLNVDQTVEQLPTGVRRPPASLRTATGRGHDREAVLESLLQRLEARYGDWVRGGLSELMPEIAARDFLRGRRVRHDGHEATTFQIDPEGRLVLRLPDGSTRAVESGEVELVDG